MNRIERRCLIGSTGVHLLLALVLLVGPGFLAPKNQVPDEPVIDFVPSILVDAAIAGGGNPNASPLPPINKPDTSTPPPPVQKEDPKPDPPTPEPEKKKAPEPEPVADKTTKTDERDPDSVETEKKWTPRKVTADLTKKTRSDNDAKKKAEAVRQQRERDARLATASKILGTANSISASSGTRIEIGEYGPGGGGPAYASYAAWVKKKYDDAWIAPEDTASDDAVAKVSVTIARNGDVISARIIRPSGDSQVDSSVRKALDRVPFIAPFPAGSTDKDRTYIINFNLKAKRSIG